MVVKFSIQKRKYGSSNLMAYSITQPIHEARFLDKGVKKK
jgi:hypothetical protein